MSARLASPLPPSSPRTTTVFTSGNSQAVRLPKEFRFKAQQVLIERRGDEIVLRERRQTVGEALASLRPLTADEADELDRCMKAAKDMRPPEEREWFSAKSNPQDPAEARPAKRTPVGAKARPAKGRK